MRILFISPLGYPITPETRYSGIEKLVWQYANELSKSLDVTVMGHSESVLPKGVDSLPTSPKPGEDIFLFAEMRQYIAYQFMLRKFDIIHDFSHQHFASRYNKKLPSLNLFWHAPSIQQYPKAPYNIVALSQWAAKEFKRVYKQEAMFVQSIVIDPAEYHPKGEHGDRFLTLGIMTPQKGNLAAIMLCKEFGLPLDVVGASAGANDYENAIKSMCDGEMIKFHGEVSDEVKIKLLQSCRALLYITPEAYTEVTSHKVQEALFCQAPVITTSGGAMPEIITHGVNGYLCATEQDYKDAIKNVDKLNPAQEFDGVVARYSLENVCRDYMMLYDKVAGGLRW